MGYSIVAGDIEKHKDVVISLLKRNFDDLNAKRFAWIYENYPKGLPRIYLIHHRKSDSFVGMGTLFPGSVTLSGSRVRIYIPGDFVIDREHRSFTSARMLIKKGINICHKNDPCLLLAVPNDKSGPVLLRSGFNILSDSHDMVQMIRTRYHLSRKIQSKTLAQVLSWPLDLLLRLRLRNSLKYHAGDYRYEILSRFDERFDPLWERMSGSFKFFGDRDSRYLNWRIMESPYNSNRVFTLFSTGTDEVLGYVAFFVDDGRACMVDMAFNGNWTNFHVLFHLFTRYQARQGIHSIAVNFSGSEKLMQEFKKRGFLLRDSSKKVLFYSSSENLNVPELIGTGDWYLTAANNDV